MRVDFAYRMDAEEDLPNSVLWGWSHGDPLAPECFTDEPRLAAKIDFTLPLHLAHLIRAAIFPHRWLFGERSGTGLIAAGGHPQVQGFMRPVVVVDLAPGVEASLAFTQVREDSALQDCDHQGALEPFFFALRLRMPGPTVNDVHPQPQQPDGHARMPH